MRKGVFANGRHAFFPLFLFSDKGGQFLWIGYGVGTLPAAQKSPVLQFSHRPGDGDPVGV